MNWQSPGGAVQSEIGLMLPTTTPGPCSRDGEKPHKRDGWLFLQGQSKWFFLRQINGVSLPKIFSHLARGAWRRYGIAACIADP